ALFRPAMHWMERAPQSLSTVERRVRRISRPLAKLQETTARVQEAASPKGGGTSVSVQQPSLLAKATGSLATFGATLLTIIFLTFFLMASGDLFMSRTIESIPALSDKKKAVRIAREIEDSVSAYLATVTAVNVGLGLVTWGVLELLGMPNAALWGAVAGILNFVPYVGAVLTMLVIGVAAVASFESTSRALIMPIAFFVINMLESNVFTPLVLERRFPLNSVAIFIGLLVWWFLWGIPGALIAVPLMVTLNIACDHIEVLRPYGAFLRR
ncbi:MAG: AI-2E family transporter, partial [Gemmatimonadaceae bacterium]